MHAGSPVILMSVSPHVCWHEDGVPADVAPPRLVLRMGRFRDKLTARATCGTSANSPASSLESILGVSERPTTII
jgi:hypothetical protein